MISGYFLTDGGLDLFSIFEAFSGDCLQLFLLQFRNQLGNLRQKVIEMVDWLIGWLVVSPPHLTVSVHQEGEIVIRREHISVFQPCHIKKTNMIINSKQMLCNVFINFYLFSPVSIGIGSACRLANQVHSEKTNLGKKTRSENVVIN